MMLAEGVSVKETRRNAHHVCEDMLGESLGLRIESRLKLLAKWDPKRYGDRIQSDVDMTIRVTIDDPTARVSAQIVSAIQSLPKP